MTGLNVAYAAGLHIAESSILGTSFFFVLLFLSRYFLLHEHRAKTQNELVHPLNS